MHHLVQNIEARPRPVVQAACGILWKLRCLLEASRIQENGTDENNHWNLVRTGVSNAEAIGETKH